MLRMYKYRLYPSVKHEKRLFKQFKICKEVHNTLLAESIQLLTTHKYDFNSLVKDIKITCSEYYSQPYSQVLQNVSDRLHKAFANFFRRVKERAKKKGYPRFKSRIHSITYPQKGFEMVGNKLNVSKLGNMPIRLHRPLKGKAKTLTIKVNKAGQWFACFSCDITSSNNLNAVAKNPSEDEDAVGIDVGLEHFAVLSNGEAVANPRVLVKSEKRLKLLQRRLSRKKKGSVNRRKARLKLAKQHIKVSNIRVDWLHKLSRSLTIRYGTICVEDLNIKGMVHNHCLAKHIHDASWGAFIDMLSYKAVTCGGQLVKVDPRNTSRACSRCGTIAEMTLNEREFLCPMCGFVCHRDLNSAINILKLGLDEPEVTPVDRPPLHLLSGGASGLVEAGTICQAQPSSSG